MVICVILDGELVGLGRAADRVPAIQAALAELERREKIFRQVGREVKKRDCFIGIDEAARFLTISPAALLKLVRNEGMPFHEIDGKIMFTKRGINRWIEKLSLSGEGKGEEQK